MQSIFTNIKCREIILSNANENGYIILYDLFSRLWYIATCGPFCKDATHILLYISLLYLHVYLSMGYINLKYSVLIFISIFNHLELWTKALYTFFQ